MCVYVCVCVCVYMCVHVCIIHIQNTYVQRDGDAHGQRLWKKHEHICSANRQLINCMGRNVVLELSDQFYKYLFSTLRCGRFAPIRERIWSKQEYKKKNYSAIRALTNMVAMLWTTAVLFAQGRHILNKFSIDYFCFIFLSPPNRSIQHEQRMISDFACILFGYLACFLSFRFVISGNSLSRQHTLAKCTMQTRQHRDGSCPAFSFACAIFISIRFPSSGCFWLIFLNQLKTYNLCCYRHSTHSFSCSGRSDEEAPLMASPSSIP